MVNEAPNDNETTTRTSNVTNCSVLAVEIEEEEHIGRVARATLLQPMYENNVSVTTNASVIIQANLYTQFGPVYLGMVAGGIMDAFPERPFRILIESAWSSVIKLAKNKQVTITCSPPLELIHNKIDEPFSYPVLRLLCSSVNFIHYKQTPSHL